MTRTMTEPMRVLLIDDDQDDYLVTRELLAEVPGQPFTLDWAGDYETGLAVLARREHDICLLDYRLGARNGLDLLREAKARGLGATVIMLTGQIEDDLDNAALLGGVAAFLKKDRLDAGQLDRAIRYALQQSRHAEELERAVQERTSELAGANASLQLADRRKNEFIALLGHELRNPLAPIVNALHILRLDDPGAKATRAAMDMMERQVAQMVRLVDDLLDAGRISTGKMELRRTRVELASVVNHAVEAARPACEALGQTLVARLPAAPIYLDGDAARLAQVAGNLLHNASKFTPQGGRIELEIDNDGGHAVLRVRDNGAGIPAGQLSRIFELFAQVDGTVERARGGLGIGLTLAKTLVEMHGGTIQATSAGPGRGSEFIVRLPALAATPRAEPSGAPARPLTLTGQRRVLVVDDNRDAAESLAMIIQLDGHAVRIAHDGPSAIDAAATWEPDLVLLDIGLPGMSGYEAARRMRAQQGTRRMQLVAVTGWGQAEDQRKSVEAGFEAHLVKPIEPELLAALLAEPPR